MNDKLYLMISNDCNKNCKHCYMRDKKDSGLSYISDLSDRNIDKITSYIKYNDIKTVILYGYGEPLYSIDINRLILLVNSIRKHTKAKIKLQTNLNYELTPMHILLFKNIDTIKIPFDIKGVRFKTYKELIQWFYNLRTISKSHNDIVMEVTITRYVYETDPNKWNHFIDKLISKGYINQCYFHPIQLAGNALDNSKDLMYEISDKKANTKISTWISKVFLNGFRYDPVDYNKIFPKEDSLLKPVLLWDDIYDRPHKTYIYKFSSKDMKSLILGY